MRYRFLPRVTVFALSLFLGIAVCSRPLCAADDAEVAGDHEMEHADEGASGDGHDAHASHNINPVSLDPDLAIVTAIIFLSLLAVLWKFAWGPIVGAIDAREKSVADNLAGAAQANDEAKRLLAEHESKLAAAAADVRQMLDDARKDAESQKQSILDQAQSAAQSEKDRALREIETAKNAALANLAETSVDTAVNLAGKIVQRQLTADDHSQLINDALERFPSKN